MPMQHAGLGLPSQVQQTISQERQGAPECCPRMSARDVRSRLQGDQGVLHLADSTEQELLNRLAAIRAATEIMLDNEDLPLKERLAFLKVIERESGRLLGLVHRAGVSEESLLALS